MAHDVVALLPLPRQTQRVLEQSITHKLAHLAEVRVLAAMVVQEMLARKSRARMRMHFSHILHSWRYRRPLLTWSRPTGWRMHPTGILAPKMPT